MKKFGFKNYPSEFNSAIYRSVFIIQCYSFAQSTTSKNSEIFYIINIFYQEIDKLGTTFETKLLISVLKSTKIKFL